MPGTDTSVAALRLAPTAERQYRGRIHMSDSDDPFDDDPERPITEGDLDRIADPAGQIGADERRRVVEEVRILRRVLVVAYEHVSSARDFGHPLLSLKEAPPAPFLQMLKVFLDARWLPPSAEDSTKD